MASYSVVRSKVATLTGSTVDTVTLTQRWDQIEVTNITGTGRINFTLNGTTPTVDGDFLGVDPAGALRVLANSFTSNTVVVKVIGDSNVYRVTGIEGLNP